MNKMIINHLEKLIVTSDCATILKEMEVQHPAAKMLVLAAHMQEQEVSILLLALPFLERKLCPSRTWIFVVD
jgi:hypothetical protein